MLQIQTQLLPPCGIYKVSLPFSLWDQFVFSSKIRIDWKNPPNSVCRFVKLVPPCLFLSNLCNVRCVVYCKSDQFEWGNSVYPYTHMYGDTRLVKVRRHSHWWPIKLGSFQLKILIQFDKHQSKTASDSIYDTLSILHICHNHHNRWLCKNIQSSVKFSNVYVKEAALILHKMCNLAHNV